jgi:hypothetical protein
VDGYQAASGGDRSNGIECRGNPFRRAGHRGDGRKVACSVREMVAVRRAIGVEAPDALRPSAST